MLIFDAGRKLKLPETISSKRVIFAPPRILDIQNNPHPLGLTWISEWILSNRVFHSALIYFWRLDGHQICKLNLVWRLPWETEMRPFMKIWGKYLLIKQFQRYDYFFTVHSALFYSRVDYESKMFQTAKKSHLWNYLSERDLPYIFINGRISASQGNFQTKSKLHISWPSSLPKYIKPLLKTL